MSKRSRERLSWRARRGVVGVFIPLDEVAEEILSDEGQDDEVVGEYDDEDDRDDFE